MIGPSAARASAQARALEGDGFVHRAVAPTTPPAGHLQPPGLGEELAVHLGGLLEFLAVRIPDIAVARPS